MIVYYVIVYQMITLATTTRTRGWNKCVKRYIRAMKCMRPFSKPFWALVLVVVPLPEKADRTDRASQNGTFWPRQLNVGAMIWLTRERTTASLMRRNTWYRCSSYDSVPHHMSNSRHATQRSIWTCQAWCSKLGGLVKCLDVSALAACTAIIVVKWTTSTKQTQRHDILRAGEQSENNNVQK